MEPVKCRTGCVVQVVVFDPRQAYPEFVVFYRTDPETPAQRRARLHQQPRKKPCDCTQQCRVCIVGLGRLSQTRDRWFECWNPDCHGYPLARNEVPNDDDQYDVACDIHLDNNRRDAEAACVFCKATGIVGSGVGRKECTDCNGEGRAHTEDWTLCHRCQGEARKWEWDTDRKCKMCSNTGRILCRKVSECFKCEAKGRYQNTSGAAVTCPDCTGCGVLRGTFSRCSMCTGDGFYESNRSKRETCHACQGSGSLRGIWSCCTKCGTRGSYTRDGDSDPKQCEQCTGKGSRKGRWTRCGMCTGHGSYKTKDGALISCPPCSGAGTLPGVWTHCAKCKTHGWCKTTQGNEQPCEACDTKGSLFGYWSECLYVASSACLPNFGHRHILAVRMPTPPGAIVFPAFASVLTSGTTSLCS